MNKTRETIFSGIQPSGIIHLGNYLGAISQWLKMQDDNFCIFCVVDYHAITAKQDSSKLDDNIKNIVKIYLASGLDPKKCAIFQQSDIKEHTELAWILNCTSARVSDLNKMTQFKDKSKDKVNVGVGLFDYPVLMAADILLYNTDKVPVGEDQLQHIELTKTLAKRFNNDYTEVFKIPQALTNKEGARIMALDEPEKKMSKSAKSEANYISLLDSPEKAKKKIMKAVTDSENKVKYNPKTKPAISNLLTIYSSLTNKKIKEIEKEYKNKGYGDFKKGLAQEVETFLQDFQKKYNKISDKEVKKVLAQGKEKLEKRAQRKVKEVKKAVGIK